MVARTLGLVALLAATASGAYVGRVVRQGNEERTAPGAKCAGADGQEFIPYLGCTDGYECTGEAEDFGRICVKSTADSGGEPTTGATTAAPTVTGAEGDAATAAAAADDSAAAGETDGEDGGSATTGSTDAPTSGDGETATAATGGEGGETATEATAGAEGEGEGGETAADDAEGSDAAAGSEDTAAGSDDAAAGSEDAATSEGTDAAAAGAAGAGDAEATTAPDDAESETDDGVAVAGAGITTDDADDAADDAAGASATDETADVSETPEESPEDTPEETAEESDEDDESPAPSEDEDDGSVCFPEDASVELQDGSIIPISQVSIGDMVKVGAGEYSKVFMFTHKNAGVVHKFVTLKTASGASLSLTKGHYIYADGSLVAAGSVKAGATVTLGNGEVDTVVAVGSTVSTGLFNPQTVHGDIVVNGVVSSTYTTAVEPTFAHAILAPFRFMNTMGLYLTALESGSQRLADAAPSGASLVF